MSWWRRRSLRGAMLACLVVVAAVAGAQAWLRRDTRYVPGALEEGIVDSLGRRLPGELPPLRFADVTDTAGLRFRHFPAGRCGKLPEDMGSGVALGDFDGDGWTDVFLVNIAAPFGADLATAPEEGRCALFRNRGDGSFEDVTAGAGLALSVLGQAAAFVDVDSDGDLDLVVTCYPELLLFENDGAGRFRDITAAAGLETFRGFWTGVAVGDADRDGSPELYVCGYVKYSESQAVSGGAVAQFGVEIDVAINPSSFEPERNLYLVRRPGGRYEDRAPELGIHDERGRSLGALFTDVTGDGWPDIYVANDVSDNAFFVNRGDGTFDDATARARLGDYRGAMGLAAADFDRDGDVDLFVTHWVAQENALYRNDTLALDPSRTVLNYNDVADRYGLGQASLDRVGWATRFVDFDGDGELDLFVINGSTIPLQGRKHDLTPQRSQLFWNAGGKRGYFELGAHAAEFFAQSLVGRGGATFDFDLDGDDDLLATVHGGSPRLLRNDAPLRAGWVRVQLRQGKGNRFALGATVTASIGERTATEISDSQGSYLSQHAVGEVAFGLGGAAQVERIVVTWPDGTRESVGPVLRDSLLIWTKGAAPRVRLAPGARDATLQPNSVDERRRFFEALEGANRARMAGEDSQATRHYLEALAMWPSHEDALYNLGNCLVGLDQPDAALTAFRRLVEHHPLSSRGWMQIGVVLLRCHADDLASLRDARSAFEHCHTINPEESLPAARLGVVALLLGERELAERRLEQALALNPTSCEALYFRGLVAWSGGDRAGAQSFLERAHQVARVVPASTAAGMTSEGDTRAGAPMLAEPAAREDAWCDRWRSLAARLTDAQTEYGGWR